MSDANRQRVCRVTFCALLAATLAWAAAPTAASSTGATTRNLRILAAGDSYAAGEGLPNIQAGEGGCQRALGLKSEGSTTPSKAWPVVLKELFENASGPARWTVDPFWFVACTGNVSSQFAKEGTQRGNGPQLREAQAGAGPAPWDVITLSFGGNDVGFAEILRDCIGLDSDLLDPEVVAVVPTAAAALLNGSFAGCSLTEQEMKDRIERRLPSRLGDLYDQVAENATDGGLIVVTGYPQLFAEPSMWSNREKLINRCNRVSEGDARAIRGATGYLNQTIGSAVAKAAEEHKEQTWVFVDVNRAFENGGSSHGLCGPAEWINGFSFGGISDGDLRALDPGPMRDVVSRAFNRSFHPNQAGHDGYAQVAATRISASGWKPIDVVDAALPPQSAPPEVGDGSYGPFRVGMSLEEAKATGWLVSEEQTCADLLGMGAEPGELLYSFADPSDPTNTGAVDFLGYAVTEIRITAERVRFRGGLTIGRSQGVHEVTDVLTSSGFQVELTSVFEQDDYIEGVSPDGATFGLYHDGQSMTVGVPQLVLCD